MCDDVVCGGAAGGLLVSQAAVVCTPFPNNIGLSNILLLPINILIGTRKIIGQ